MARKFFVALTVILLALSFPFTTAMAAEADSSSESEAKKGIDAILLIDASGSMRYSDTERTALEAAAMFIDMMETNNSRVGVVAFTDEIQSVIPLTPVSNTDDKEDIKRQIQRFSYYGYTDIGMTLTEAVDMLMAGVTPGNSPVMVLLTDGAIEINPNTGRTPEMSNADVRAALDNLNGRAPIYTIGLNANDTVDVGFLRRVSNETVGRSYITADAAELPGIFNEIFADHIRSSLIEIAAFETEEGQYTDVIIPIHNNYVAEANIIMLSSQPLADVKLLTPAREEAVFDDVNISLTHSNRYSMVKIVSPQEGDWLLSVKGLPNDTVTVNLIYNFNVNVNVAVTQDGREKEFFSKDAPLLVTAALDSATPENLPADLYSGAIAALDVYDLNLVAIESIPMTLAGDSFTVEYFPVSPRDVRFSVRVSHAEFEKSSDYIAVSYEQPLIATPAPAVETPAEPTPPPEPTPSPAPEPTGSADNSDATDFEPTPTPTPEPTPEVTVTPAPSIESAPPADADDEGNLLIRAGIPLAALLVIALIVFLVVKNRGGAVFFGYIEVRGKPDGGKYTALEAPDLSTFAGKTSLLSFLTSTLSNKSRNILESPINLAGLNMRPGTDRGKPSVTLENTGQCLIKDKNGNVITGRKIDWREDRTLILTAPDSKARIEITYRAGKES